jgi:hypothetical protein
VVESLNFTNQNWSRIFKDFTKWILFPKVGRKNTNRGLYWRKHSILHWLRRQKILIDFGQKLEIPAIVVHTYIASATASTASEAVAPKTRENSRITFWIVRCGVSWAKWQKPAKNLIQTFSENDRLYLRLQKFEKWWIWKWPATELMWICCNFIGKIVKPHQGNSFLVGFSHLEPLCSVMCKFGLDQSFERHVKGFRSSNHRLQIDSVYQIVKNVAKKRLNYITQPIC